MYRCVEACQPNIIVHLGDHYDDGETLAEKYPHIPLHQVAGNCDKYRAPISAREMLCYPLGGVMMYMTHGHIHYVKQGIGALLSDARKYNARAVLYGHTHIPDCHQQADGLWVLNPGSAGYGGGSAGLIEAENDQILSCRIITSENLEEFV